MGFLFCDKSSETCLEKIKLFFEINKKSKYIKTDNGLEFKNKLIYNYLEKENVKIIHSRSHHPQTNGYIERYHREVDKFIKAYLNNLDSFSDIDIENALNNYIIFHNNSRKTSTKYTSNEIRDITDPHLIESIINNIIKSFKKHYINKDEIFDKEEKLLFWSNTICKYNDIHIKNPNDKTGCFLYPCIFKNYINNDIIIVDLVTRGDIDEYVFKELKGNINCFIIILLLL